MPCSTHSQYHICTNLPEVWLAEYLQMVDVWCKRWPSSVASSSSGSAIVAPTMAPMVRETAPEMVGETSPEMVGETAPEMVGETAPEMVGETAPEMVGETAPEMVGETAPEMVGETAPEMVGETAPEMVGETAPEMVRETAPEMVRETAPEMVGETAPEMVFDMEFQDSAQTINDDIVKLKKTPHGIEMLDKLAASMDSTLKTQLYIYYLTGIACLTKDTRAEGLIQQFASLITLQTSAFSTQVIQVKLGAEGLLWRQQELFQQP